MRVFVYEFITGGGTFSKREWGMPGGSLLSEGMAMISAVARDFARIDNVDVHGLWDVRLTPLKLPRVSWHTVSDANHEHDTFRALASRCELSLIIAPEIEHMLLERCRLVEVAGGTLVGPSVDFVCVASDKYLTFRALSAANVPVPKQIPLNHGVDLDRLAYPVIVKSRNGAGSNGVFRIDSSNEADARFTRDETWCLESYCPGRAASVAFLCGCKGHVPMAPCWQHLSSDGTFSYLGGSTIDESDLVERCIRIGRLAISALPPTTGYIGVDLVLGARDDGSEDVVIEVNPRLTTSYVGLRAMTSDNLARVLLDVYQGRSPLPRFDRGTVTFSADGNIVGQEV